MEIIDEVRQTIASVLKVPVDTLTPETRLSDIGAESLDVIEIIFQLEEKFGISIPFQANEAARAGSDAGPMPFATIGEAAAAVKQLVDAKAPS